MIKSEWMEDGNRGRLYSSRQVGKWTIAEAAGGQLQCWRLNDTHFGTILAVEMTVCTNFMSIRYIGRLEEEVQVCKIFLRRME